MKKHLYTILHIILPLQQIWAQTDSSAASSANRAGALRQPQTVPLVRLEPEQFNQGHIIEPVQLVQGRVAGFTVARPGSDLNGRFATRIRGLSSRFSNTEPLVVLNGVPGASLQLIDPDDISSITVLKGASASAMYGMRGAAGVILLETRQGHTERLSVEYEGQAALDQATRHYMVLNAGEFLHEGGNDLSPFSNADTDWQGQIMRNGLSHAHHLRIGAGIGKGSLRAALHYRNANGVLRENGLQQYSGNLAWSQSFWKERICLTGSLLAARRNAGYGFPEAFRYAITFNPTAPLYSDDPQWTDFGGYVQPALFDSYNPVALVEQNSNRGQTDRLMGNLYASAELFRGFSLNLRVAEERSNTLTGEYYSPQTRYRSNNQMGSLRRFHGEQTGRLLESTGHYIFQAGANTKVDLSGGYSWQRFEYEANDTIATGDFGLTKNSALSTFEPLVLAPGYQSGAFSKGKNTLAGFFGRTRIGFRERYFLEAGLRHEGSSRLGENRHWGNFSFISVGADLSKILSIKAFDHLMLRAGYGIAGQQPPADGLSRQVLSPSANVFYNGEYIIGYHPSTNENPDLKWEEKREFNLGLDVALNDGKVSASVDYFKNTSSDLIWGQNVPTPPNIAATTYLNLMEFSGKGFEASLEWNNILDNEKLDWSANLVYTRYAAEVEKTGSPDPLTLGYPGAPGMCCSQYILVREGQPLGQLWGVVRAGLNADGSVRYEDIDGDGKTGGSEIELYDQDQTLIGNGLPSFELGFQNRLRWRRFDLNVFLRGAFGHSLMHENRLFYENRIASGVFFSLNQIRTKYFDPRVTVFNRIDNTFVEKASYLRLDNVTLGYTFRLPEKSRVRKARVYVGGQNLLTFSSYTGIDPEIRLADAGPTDNGSRSLASPDPFVPGIDRRTTYFLSRTFVFGFNIGF